MSFEELPKPEPDYHVNDSILLPDFWDGFDPYDLVYNKPRLVILGQTYRYCKAHNVDRIRFNQLRLLSEKMLSKLSNGKRNVLHSTFQTIMHSMSNEDIPKNKRYVTRIPVEVEGKKGKKTEVYFVANLDLIENIIKAEKILNLESDHKLLFRKVVEGQDEIITIIKRHRSITEPQIKSFDKVGLEVRDGKTGQVKKMG